jgi:hypothetical protein
VTRISEEFIGSMIKDEKKIMSQNALEKIFVAKEQIKSNFNMLRLRVVDKEFYEEIEKNSELQILIDKYHCKSFQSHLILEKNYERR